MVKESLKKIKSKTQKFLQENFQTLAKIGLAVAAVVILPDSVTYAQTASASSNISVITEPLSRMETLMSGPVPKAIVTIGAATGAASWALNIENQITKTASTGSGDIYQSNDRIFDSVRSLRWTRKKQKMLRGLNCRFIVR